MASKRSRSNRSGIQPTLTWCLKAVSPRAQEFFSANLGPNTKIEVATEMAKFKTKLKRLLSYAQDRSVRAMEDMTDEIAGQLLDDVYDRWCYIGVSPELKQTIKEARRAAATADAIEILERKVLSKRAKIYDIYIPRGLNVGEIRSVIREALQRKTVPRRQYVYVAWSVRPEKYHYIGMAKGWGRICNLDRHGNLCAALMNSSMLSLVYAGRVDGTKDLRGIEAALLQVIKIRTGKRPTHNRSEGHLPELPDKRKYFSYLANFFKQVARESI